MPWQVLHKRRASKCLPAVRLHTGHPPLTSLRSFAPPYAEAKGAYDHRDRRISARQRPRFTESPPNPPSNSQTQLKL